MHIHQFILEMVSTDHCVSFQTKDCVQVKISAYVGPNAAFGWHCLWHLYSDVWQTCDNVVYIILCGCPIVLDDGGMVQGAEDSDLNRYVQSKTHLYCAMIYSMYCKSWKLW